MVYCDSIVVFFISIICGYSIEYWVDWILCLFNVRWLCIGFIGIRLNNSWRLKYGDILIFLEV